MFICTRIANVAKATELEIQPHIRSAIGTNLRSQVLQFTLVSKHDALQLDVIVGLVAMLVLDCVILAASRLHNHRRTEHGGCRLDVEICPLSEDSDEIESPVRLPDDSVLRLAVLQCVTLDCTDGWCRTSFGVRLCLHYPVLKDQRIANCELLRAISVVGKVVEVLLPVVTAQLVEVMAVATTIGVPLATLESDGQVVSDSFAVQRATAYSVLTRSAINNGTSSNSRSVSFAAPRKSKLMTIGTPVLTPVY